MLTNKQINHIKKEHPKKSVEQIAEELKLPLAEVYKALGLAKDLWALRLENAMEVLVIMLLALAPLVFMRGMHDFADLPQRTFIQIVVTLLVLLWVAKIAIKQEIKVFKNPLYFFAAGFMLWSWTTLVWAQNRYEGYYAAIHLSFCAVVLLVISTTFNRDRCLQRFLFALLIAVAAVIACGLAQQFFQWQWIPMSISPSATFGNPNMAADFVATLFPVLLTMVFYYRKDLLRCAVLAASLLSLVYLYYTGSRGAGLAIGCSLHWMAFLYYSKRYKITGRAAATGLLIIAGLSLIIIYAFPSGIDTIRAKALSEYRLVAWRNSVEMVKDRPLSGFGSGNFKVFYPAYSRKAIIDRAIDTTKYLGRAHNDYIQIAVEQGLPGLLLFLLLPGYGLIMTWRLLKQTDDHPQQWIIIGLSGGLIAFMVVAFFSFPMQRSIPPLIVFTYLSIVVIIYNQQFLNKKAWDLKISPTVGLIIFCCLLVIGFAVNRFNWKNIQCERYFSQALGAEQRGLNILVLSAGLRAHSYVEERMDVLITVGRAYAATGEYGKAIETLEKVISRYPYNLNALFFLGAAYTNADKTGKALDIFKHVLEIKPDFPEVLKIIYSLKTRGKARVSLN